MIDSTMPMTHKNSIPVGVSRPRYGVIHKSVGVFRNSELNDVSRTKEKQPTTTQVSNQSYLHFGKSILQCLFT